MNILFFLPGIKNKGGVERATINLLNSFSLRSEINTYLAVLNYDENDIAFELDYRQIKINRWVKIFIVIFGINLLVNINAFRFNLRKSLFKIENLSMYYLLKQRVTTEEML